MKTDFAVQTKGNTRRERKRNRQIVRERNTLKQIERYLEDTDGRVPRGYR